MALDSASHPSKRIFRQARAKPLRIPTMQTQPRHKKAANSSKASRASQTARASHIARVSHTAQKTAAKAVPRQRQQRHDTLGMIGALPTIARKKATSKKQTSITRSSEGVKKAGKSARSTKSAPSTRQLKAAKSKAAQTKSKAGQASAGTTGATGTGAAARIKLRIRKRWLVNFMLVLPLALALAGFSALQGKQTQWAAAPFEDTRRGRILASDGTILAEGDVGQRRYPQGAVAGHMVGFTGAKQDDGSYGLEGIEHTMDDYLQAGKDITLTVDMTLQTVAQSELRQAVLDNQAENGAVVMLEVGTGRIVAAASYPEYNLQDWQSALQQPNHPTINRAFLQQVEPGSTMKPFIMAAALQAGKVVPEEMFHTPMRYRVGTKTFQDSMTHEEYISVNQFLKYSSNSGMIQLAQRFEAQEMYAWLENFGFGISPSIKFVYSREGQLNPWWAWVPQDQASTAIGQSVSVTALQLAAAYSIIANEGIYTPPYLVEGSYAGEARQVLEPTVTHTILDMMMEVVAYRGARVALVPGVLVAGKTGTADIYDAKAGTYIDGDYTTSFAGVFPADKPQYVVVVYVQKPRNQYRFGSTVAAPVFQRIAAETVALKGIARNPNYAHYTQGQPFEW